MGGFRVATHGIDMPACNGASGNIGINQDDDQSDYSRPGKTLVTGHDPSDQRNDSGYENRNILTRPVLVNSANRLNLCLIVTAIDYPDINHPCVDMCLAQVLFRWESAEGVVNPKAVKLFVF